MEYTFLNGFSMVFETVLGRSWADLGARGPFFEKKVAVARELGMGNHRSRATATFFLEKCTVFEPQPLFW